MESVANTNYLALICLAFILLKDSNNMVYYSKEIGGILMKKLFMIGVGGSARNANVEVHGMQFVYAESLEDSFPILLERWYGDSIHLDGYTELMYIDGYEIDKSLSSKKNLYMIVYGGYKSDVIDELHDYHFVLADNPIDAKKVAKKDMKKFTYMNHVDEIVDVFQQQDYVLGLHLPIRPLRIILILISL